MAAVVDTSTARTPIISRLNTLKAYRASRMALSWKKAPSHIEFNRIGTQIRVFGPAFCLLSNRTLRFIQPGCSPRGTRRHEWTINELDFRPEDWTYDYSQQLLVLIERISVCVFRTNLCLHYSLKHRVETVEYERRIHLCSSDTGKPHLLATKSTIDFTFGGDDVTVQVRQYAAMVAVLVVEQDYITISMLSVWNWKTGELLYVSHVGFSIRPISFVKYNDTFTSVYMAIQESPATSRPSLS